MHKKGLHTRETLGCNFASAPGPGPGLGSVGLGRSVGFSRFTGFLGALLLFFCCGAPPHRLSYPLTEARKMYARAPLHLRGASPKTGETGFEILDLQYAL